METIALYNNMIFEIINSKKLVFGTQMPRNFIVRELDLRFIQIFDGDERIFVSTFKHKYPNHSIQIFKNSKKPLLKTNRDFIEKCLNSNDPIWIEVKSTLREYKISKLFK